jgi:hypothetical protein
MQGMPARFLAEGAQKSADKRPPPMAACFAKGGVFVIGRNIKGP